MRRAVPIHLAQSERNRLRVLAASRSEARRIVVRARIVLLAAEGRENRAIADTLGTNAGTVARWRRRFLDQRIGGVEHDAPRPGRPPVIPTSTIQLIVRTSRGRSPTETSRWTARRLARTFGVSKTTVQRLWKAHRLTRRRRPEATLPGAGLEFADKVTDFVGLFLDPPQRALAFSVDERSSVFPSMGTVDPKRAIEATHDQVAEFRRFLQTVDRETPEGLDVHLLLDSRAIPILPAVRRWVVRHPRFILHLLSESPAGPNLIDRLLQGFTKKQIRPGTPASALRLHRSIRRYLANLEEPHRAFVWTANSAEIRSRTGMRPNTIGYYWTKT